MQLTLENKFQLELCIFSHNISFFFFLTSQNYDAIIVRSDTKITSDVLAAGAAGRLKAVGRAGVGVDNIDIESASKNNVVVLKSVSPRQSTFRLLLSAKNLFTLF